MGGRANAERRPAASRFAVGAALGCAVWMGLGFHPSTTAADDGSLRRQVERLEANQTRLRREVEEIKRLVRDLAEQSRGTAFEPVTLTLEGVTFIGAADAPVTVIEFTDDKCPFCQRHARTTFPLLRKHYVATGKLRYGIREFPAESLHPGAEKLAQGLLCAGEQGKYWDLREQLMSDQGRVPDWARVPKFGPAVGLDMDRFQSCVSEEKYRTKVRDDLRLGAEIGLTGTPTFYLGSSPEPGKNEFTATRMLRGAQPYTVFKQTIETLVAAR